MWNVTHFSYFNTDTIQNIFLHFLCKKYLIILDIIDAHLQTM